MVNGVVIRIGFNILVVMRLVRVASIVPVVAIYIVRVAALVMPVVHHQPLPNLVVVRSHSYPFIMLWNERRIAVWNLRLA